jgi:hypothetical protein
LPPLSCGQLGQLLFQLGDAGSGRGQGAGVGEVGLG